jgi:nicotinamidase-related amidase
VNVDTKTVVLVVDLQLGMFNGERLAPIHDGEALLTRVAWLLDRARDAGVKVVYVRHGGEAGSLLETDTDNWQIHPAVAPMPGEAIVDKRMPDAFADMGLGEMLAAIGARRLIVVGAQTEVCVDTTCRRAASLGFAVVLVADGHGTWDNATLTAEQIVRHTNETMDGRFARVVAMDDLGFGARGGG